MMETTEYNNYAIRTLLNLNKKDAILFRDECEDLTDRSHMTFGGWRDIMRLTVLAVAEAALTITTILSSRRLDQGHAVFNKEGNGSFFWDNVAVKFVPKDYFVSHLAERTGLSHEVMEPVWKAIVKGCLNGKDCLPGLKNCDGKVVLDHETL